MSLAAWLSRPEQKAQTNLAWLAGALDAESEAAVQDALDRAAQGRTVMVIAPRLSTVQNADEVLDIDDGTVLERCTHQELLAKGTKPHHCDSTSSHG